MIQRYLPGDGALIVIGEDYGEGSSIMQERSHAYAMKSQIWLMDPRPDLPTLVRMVEEGKISAKSGKDILPAKAYPYGIKVEVGSLTYDDVTALFTVQLSVKDSENKNTLAETTFEVEKLNVTTEDTAEGHARAEDIRNTEN